MTKKHLGFALTAILSFAMFPLFGQNSTTEINNNWATWRGPFKTGAAAKCNPPVEFSETQNLKWKIEIPGKGHATPIVWGNQMIIQTAVPTDQKQEKGEPKQEGGRMGPPANSTDVIHQFKVISVDRNTGEFLWETTVREELPLERTHDLGSWASNSPVTDGEHIFAYFGSRGIFCLDFQGNILWDRDFGQMEKVMSFGEGCSPAIYNDKVVVLWDHEGQSFIVALDKTTGKDVWKVDRDEGTSWATPLILDVNGTIQVITAATSKARSYNLETGQLLWECTGLTRNVIPNPVYADGILYLMSGYRGNALMAIDLARANGDISGTDVIRWQYNQDTPYTPCPLLMDGKLYFLRANNGILTCLDAKDGKVNYTNQKLEGISSIYSSPTGANGYLYIAATNMVDVVKAGANFELISSNTLDDTFHASPVVIGNNLFLRGFKSLYCFATE